MALNPEACAAAWATAYQPIIDTGDAEAYPQTVAALYDDYSAEGEVAGAFNEGGSEGILTDALGKNTTPAELAQAFADYWATVAIIPGEPAHGGTTVLSVTNDALNQVGQFEQAIIESITDEPREPLFLHFVENLENIGIGAITWFVTEQFADGSTQTFEVNIE